VSATPPRITPLNATETPVHLPELDAPPIPRDGLFGENGGISEPPAPPVTVASPSRRSPLRRVRPHHAALSAILALSALLGTHRLAQNGYANTFYSAGVKSMLVSWHNFLFASFDPGGLVTIDKPPLAMWAQAASAELFGFSPLSLLLPEAIISTISVAVLYRVLSRRLGVAAGLAGALTLAVFPSFVAVSRDNGVDPLLILLMILACGAALNAIEDGRWRWLMACAVLVGLAFNTKTLAAYLIVPGIALAYLLCAPGAWYRRIGMLTAAGVVLGVCSFAWIALVELTPASQRPYVGSSTNNTELGLTFEYNGFGRVEGEVGGPGKIPIATGALVQRQVHHFHHIHPLTPVERARLVALRRREAARRALLAKQDSSTYLPDGRLRDPIAFGGEPSALRLFEKRLFDQGAWMLPFALLGLLAFALLTVAGARARRNGRLALLIVLGGWMLVEVAILDFSKGIVHPYYISALAPGVAAMVAAGAFAFTRFAQRRSPGFLLLPCAVGATVAVQVAILRYQHYMHWFVTVLIGGAALGLLAMTVTLALRKLAAPAMGLLLCLLLVAPAWYARTTWLAPVEGTFAAAGPRQATGDGEYGASARSMREYRDLARYVATHNPGTRWSVLTEAAPTAAPMILIGSSAGALAGYSGTDPALNGPGLSRLVARKEARYVVLGGAYASRGGNLATQAVLHVCRQVPYKSWDGPPPSPYSLVLFDCAGRERALTAQAHAKAIKVRLVS
jgi:4-amino-4-deoxy-L-arabinose transferase-like glycosyltransferase